jgi:predicted enzyme related to lactoylglutathione lyase
MAEYTDHAPGTFAWIDLAANDRAVAKKFYGELFGWNFEEKPAGPDMTYTIARLGGKDVCGLGDLMPQQREQGIPSHWMSYVAVTDAAAAAARAASLGGTILADAFDVMDVCRLAFLADPDGAVLGLFQPKTHKGAGRREEPGTLCWNEVATRKPDAVGGFYTNLFGWKTTQLPGAMGMTYTMFQNGETPIGGMFEIRPEMGPMPANWMPYIMVENVDTSFAKATGLGAKALMPPTDIPEMGRFATIMDPQGAAISIYQAPAM